MSSSPPPDPAHPPPSTSFSPALVAVLGVQFLNGLGFGLVFPVVALYGESTGLSPAGITLLVALHPLMRLLGGPVWGRLADRVGRRPVLLAGVSIQVVGHLVFALFVGPIGLGLARVLTGLGAGDAVAAAAVVGDTTGEGERARGLGLLRAANGLGLLSGPIVGGLLGLGGLHWPGFGAALAGLLSLGLVWRRCPETLPPRPAEGSVRLPQPARCLAVPLPALLIAVAAAAAMAQAESIVPLAIEHVMVPTLSLPVGLLPVQAAGEFIGPAAAGWLYQVEYGLPYEAGAVMLLLALFMSLWLQPVRALG